MNNLRDIWACAYRETCEVLAFRSIRAYYRSRYRVINLFSNRSIVDVQERVIVAQNDCCKLMDSTSWLDYEYEVEIVRGKRMYSQGKKHREYIAHAISSLGALEEDVREMGMPEAQKIRECIRFLENDSPNEYGPMVPVIDGLMLLEMRSRRPHDFQVLRRIRSFVS